MRATEKTSCHFWLGIRNRFSARKLNNRSEHIVTETTYSARLQIMLQTRCQRHRALLATLCLWQPGPRDPTACAGLLRREPLAACVRAFVPQNTKVRRQRGAGRARAGGRAAPAFWSHLAVFWHSNLAPRLISRLAVRPAGRGLLARRC